MIHIKEEKLKAAIQITLAEDKFSEKHLNEIEARLINDIMTLSVNAILYQKCPKCEGQGKVSKPPYIPGDVLEWEVSTQSSFICDVCHGEKVILMFLEAD